MNKTINFSEVTEEQIKEITGEEEPAYDSDEDRFRNTSDAGNQDPENIAPGTEEMEREINKAEDAEAEEIVPEPEKTEDADSDTVE